MIHAESSLGATSLYRASRGAAKAPWIRAFVSNAVSGRSLWLLADVPRPRRSRSPGAWEPRRRPALAVTSWREKYIGNVRPRHRRLVHARHHSNATAARLRTTGLRRGM